MRIVGKCPDCEGQIEVTVDVPAPAAESPEMSWSRAIRWVVACLMTLAISCCYITERHTLEKVRACSKEYQVFISHGVHDVTFDVGSKPEEKK